MSIPSLDTKILWGKANARCAICRKKVVVKSAANNGRTDILFGEMCHIVGEKAEGCARCKSSMPLDDRNYYHNLILLCENDHEVIDKDEATYTIERLHQIKADFELWIDSRLDEAIVDLADQLYAKLVNAIADDLQLHRLDTVSNGAINGRLPVWFVDGANQLLPMMLKTNWPGKRADIEAPLKEVESKLTTYLNIFHSNAELDQAGEFYRRVKKHREALAGSPEYDYLLNEHRAWGIRSNNALWNFVVALNNLAVAVRKELKPSFFYMEGKFAIHDEIGTTNDGDPRVYIPTEYRDLDAE